MLKPFYPHEYVESVFSIDYKKVYDKGYRAVLFDIDNTLVHHGDDSTKEIDELFQFIHNIGLKTVLLSDNSGERINRFSKNIDSFSISNANKPSVTGYLKAVEIADVKKEEALSIGDQIFRDILGANRAGIDNVLVKYLRRNNETKTGIRRQLENCILWFYKHNKSCQNRIGDIVIGDKNAAFKRKKLFCEMHPVCYAISVKKERFRRYLKDLASAEKFARTTQKEKLPAIVFGHSSNIIKRAAGIGLQSQENKKVNILLACEKINGITIHPGETFSFWKTIGESTAKRGFKEGRVLYQNRLITGSGGGLCNLANTIHLLVLHSPLDVTEFHGHSDALAPDEGKRVPFSAGTSVSYNYVDYRFKNNTRADMQLLAWCEGDLLYAELRSETDSPWSYELVEEDHRFRKEGNKYYRISKIYRNISDKQTGAVVNKELVLNNHSEVMYDYDLIPKEQIKDD
ncbi:MAG: VanW family protein [Treponema sp.]|jgi:vancomycin resistance protein VanW|nr:VanW family protein [Treponema sp.]